MDELTKGERAVVVRALRFFIHEQQVLITKSWQEDAKRRPLVFADVKQHHEKQIEAATRVLEKVSGIIR